MEQEKTNWSHVFMRITLELGIWAVGFQIGQYISPTFVSGVLTTFITFPITSFASGRFGRYLEGK